MKRTFVGTWLAGLGAAAVVLAGIVFAAPVTTEFRAVRQAHEAEIFDQFVQLLKIPNVASDRLNIHRDAEAIAELMRQQGLAPRLLGTRTDPDAPPAVYGEWRVPGAKRTLVLYAHYDGQPVNAAEWTTSPWQPTLRKPPFNPDSRVPLDSSDRLDPDMRIYARGTSDDKGGVITILSALKTLRAMHRHPTDNIKLLFEGEEEAGSPHLRDILRENNTLLAANLWLICDGPRHPSGKVEVIYGARGDLNVSLTVYGPIRPLHSGHYGNWVPNPALRLAKLLGSMKDDTGKVVIPGWYDDVLAMGEAENHAIAATTDYDEVLRRQLGIAATETREPLNEAITLPSLNINGMHSGNVGKEASNMIPATATAVLDLRLVMGNDPQRQYEKLLKFVRSQGYLVLDREPTTDERLAHPLLATVTTQGGAYGAARTPMGDPFAKSIAGAARAASSEPIVELPMAGGSLPLSIIHDALGVNSIVIGIANYDNNQHAANENLRVGNLWDGIDLYGAVLTH